MLLFEAKAEIDARLTERIENEYGKDIPEYFKALEIASKAIERQMDLADILNDMNSLDENDTWSVPLVREVLEELRYDREPAED